MYDVYNFSIICSSIIVEHLFSKPIRIYPSTQFYMH